MDLPPSRPWKSPEIPRSLIGYYIGHKASNIKAFKSNFPSLTINLNLDDSSPHFLVKINRHCQGFSITEAQVQFNNCKNIIISLLSSKINIRQSLNVLICAAKDPILHWLPLHSYLAGPNTKLTSKRAKPFYAVSLAPDDVSIRDLSESLALMNIGPERDHLLSTSHLVQEVLDLDQIAFVISNTTQDTIRDYKNYGANQVPKFTLALKTGYMGYRGRPINEVHQNVDYNVTSVLAKPFLLDSLHSLIDAKMIQHQFLSALSTEFYEPMQKYMDSEFATGSTVSQSERITLDLGIICTHSIGHFLPKAYRPWHRFKAVFEFDSVENKFVLSNKGVYSSKFANKLISLTRLNTNSLGMGLPASSRIVYRVTAAINSTTSASLDVARSLADMLLVHINRHVDQSRFIKGPLTSTYCQGLVDCIPASVQDQVLLLNIVHTITNKYTKDLIDVSVQMHCSLGNPTHETRDKSTVSLCLRQGLPNTRVIIKHKKLKDQLAQAITNQECQVVIKNGLDTILPFAHQLEDHLSTLARLFYDDLIEPSEE